MLTKYVFEIDDKRKEIPLTFVSDIHFGHSRCRVNEFKEWLGYIKKKRIYVIGLGDLLEFVPVSTSMPSMLFTQIVSPPEQLKEMTQMLLPVKKQILGLMDGNHERRLSKTCGLSISGFMADSLGCTYINDIIALIELRFPNQTYRGIIFHGSGASTKPTFQLDKLQNIVEDIDFAAIGHMHQVFCDKTIRANASGKAKVITRARTGGFLNYPGYAQEKVYPPSTVGGVILSLNQEKKNIKGIV